MLIIREGLCRGGSSPLFWPFFGIDGKLGGRVFQAFNAYYLSNSSTSTSLILFVQSRWSIHYSIDLFLFPFSTIFRWFKEKLQFIEIKKRSFFPLLFMNVEIMFIFTILSFWAFFAISLLAKHFHSFSFETSGNFRWWYISWYSKLRLDFIVGAPSFLFFSMKIKI